MRAARLAIMMAVVLIASLGASAAHAETRGKSDRVQDAPATIDITRARYSHSDDQVRVRARIPDLGPAGVATLAITRFEIFEAGYVVRMVKRVGKPARVRLLFFDHFDLHKRECDGVVGSWNDRSVRLAVSRSCLEGHAKPRVFVRFGIQRGRAVDRAPAVRRLPRG